MMGVDILALVVFFIAVICEVRVACLRKKIDVLGKDLRSSQDTRQKLRDDKDVLKDRVADLELEVEELELEVEELGELKSNMKRLIKGKEIKQ